MLEQILTYCRNWFPVEKHGGVFAIEGGAVALPFLVEGQYYRIMGSVFNDGLHQHPADDLTDEVFTGTVWALAIPKAVVNLSTEMTNWQTKNGTAGPYSSESFGGYSYNLATNGKGDAVTVWDVFAQRLKLYRRPMDVSFVAGTKPRTPDTLPYNPFPWR